MLKTGSRYYFIRHGLTEWNAEGRFQGQRDIPLNDIGRSQATANGEKLLALEGDALSGFDFVSSPLGRTSETMTLVRQAAGLPPSEFETDDALIELSYGNWEGYTEAELLVSYPQQMRERDLDKWNYMPPGQDAESYETLSWRIAAWLEMLSRPTVCVTHGGVIRVLLKLIGALDTEAAARLNVRQDRILKLEGGSAEWL